MEGQGPRETQSHRSDSEPGVRHCLLRFVLKMELHPLHPLLPLRPLPLLPPLTLLPLVPFLPLLPLLPLPVSYTHLTLPTNREV